MLPSPPASRDPTPTQGPVPAKPSDLTTQLDDLLERYLGLLDEYSQLRTQLSDTFSKGFLNLALAQRNSYQGSGRRYGQDGYDERMKAYRQVCIEQQERIVKYYDKKDKEQHSETSQSLRFDVVDRTAIESTNQRRISLATTKQALQEDVCGPSQPGKGSAFENSEQGSNEQQKLYRDPLTWYGILVPPALRQSQSNFSDIAQQLVPRLLTTASEMETVEQNIWHLRKEFADNT